MKKILLHCLTLLLIVTVLTLAFADKSSKGTPSKEVTSSNNNRRYELGQLPILSEETVDRWYPLIPLMELEGADFSFKELKKSARCFKTFLYDNGVPVGDVFGTKSENGYKNGGTFRYRPNEQYALPHIVEAFSDGDVIILDDKFERFIVTPEGTVIIANLHNDENMDLSTEQTFTLKDFLDATMRRNEYYAETRLMGHTSILDYIIVSPPTFNPMPYVFVGTAFLSISVIAALYFRRRKHRRNLD